MHPSGGSLRRFSPGQAGKALDPDALYLFNITEPDITRFPTHHLQDLFELCCGHYGAINDTTLQPKFIQSMMDQDPESWRWVLTKGGGAHWYFKFVGPDVKSVLTLGSASKIFLNS